MTDRTARHTVESVSLARLPSGRHVETTLHRYRGAEKGPVVYIQALQHGGEVNGAAVLRRLHDRLSTRQLAGEVRAVPVANPLAFDHRIYRSPTQLDAINPNMNRLWPGDPEGTLMERLVDTLWNRAQEADAIIDLHTGGPYMLSHTRFTPENARSRGLAEAFGMELIVADGTELDEAGPDMQGKLREVAGGSKIPAITPELAHSREIVESEVERGVKGILNVLRELDVLEGGVERGDPTVGREKTSLYTDASGLFRSTNVSVGERLESKRTVGTVYDPGRYGQLTSIETDESGLLLSLNRGSTVVEGESVGSLVTVDVS